MNNGNQQSLVPKIRKSLLRLMRKYRRSALTGLLMKKARGKKFSRAFAFDFGSGAKIAKRANSYLKA